MSLLLPIISYCKEKDIFLKIVDIPLCIFPKENLENYIKMTDDYDYWSRVKITYDEEILDRWLIKKKDDIPRERFPCYKCEKCIYKWKCWGPLIHYDWLYWLDEINPIIK